jgi:hypothetical protein
MKRHGALLGLVFVLAVLIGGLTILFRLRLAQGDVFPAYSTLRSDPLGARALHDALSQIPGMSVERWFKPFSDLPPMPTRTIVYAGLWSRGWTRVQREDFDAIDAAMRNGSRVVVAMRAAAAATEAEKEDTKKEQERAKERKKEMEDKTGKKSRVPEMVYVDLKRRWGADVKERVLMERQGGAVATEHARALGLPETIAWRSDVYFELEPDAGWNVLYRRGTQPVLVERRLERGTLVLAADSYFLSNEALQKDRAPALLAWIVGSPSRVVFDETHLGVSAQPGVAALARRYGLSGAFFTLLLLAVLFVWQRMAVFVPPVEAEGEVALTYHPAAGLEALLRRSVAPGELAAVCTTEWKPTARESDRARVEQALATSPKNASPVTLYNAAVRALKRR